MTNSFELIAAPHTPFDREGALALAPVALQAEHLRSVRVHGALVAGSTGEGPSLTMEERRQLAQRWVEVGDSLKVMVQVGHDSVPEARRLAEHAASIGADAICAAPPSWFKITSPKQLAETCAPIAAAAPDLPFYYYHIPVLSGVDVKMHAFLNEVKRTIPSFAGVKFSHGDVEDFSDCMRDHADRYRFLWGTDEALLTGLEAGAHGAVGSTYNFAAPLYHRLIAAFGAGDRDAAQRLQDQSILTVETLAARGYGPCAKALMGMLGVECGPARLPLPQLGKAAIIELGEELDAIGFFEWGSR